VFKEQNYRFSVSYAVLPFKVPDFNFAGACIFAKKLTRKI